MNLQLEYLARLQDVDTRLMALERQIASIPEELETAQKGIEQIEREWESAKEMAEGAEKERRKKERELETAESKLDKYNSQLLSVKTNKEYTAMLHEIEAIKDEISSLEEDILRLMEKAEASKEFIEEEGHKAGQKRKEFEGHKERIVLQLNKLKNDRDTLLSDRGEIEKNIDKELIREYQKIILVRRGIAVVTARDGSCTGCNIMLMPQLFQEIKADQERIFRCPNCHRMLFYREEKQED